MNPDRSLRYALNSEGSGALEEDYIWLENRTTVVDRLSMEDVHDKGVGVARDTFRVRPCA
jgi:hypothetical protein